MRRGVVHVLIAAGLSVGCAGCGQPTSSAQPEAARTNPVVVAPTLSVAPNTPQQQTGTTPGITRNPPNAQPGNLTPGAR
jgi:hypothetical protein